MAMPAKAITALIQAALPDAQIEMIDLAGDNNHWKAVIVSSEFAGKSRVQQHQMVYRAVQSQIDSGELHALALETRAPAS